MILKNFWHSFLGVLVNVMRFIVAGVFVFSGFVKAVDPLGTVYKLGDYAEAFGLQAIVRPGWLLLAAELLCLFEFLVGIWILFSIHRRTALTAALVFVMLMTPLTLYLALVNPVSDCGCFGDAIRLTNWQTFWKNVILLALIIPVLINHERLFRLVHPNIQWIVGAFAIVSLLLFMRSNLRHLPLYDFRPYHVGADIEASSTVPDDAPQPRFETTFILTKDGEQREFTLDDYPDSTWTFVTSRTVMVEKGYEAPMHDFTLVTDDGDDITSDLYEPGWTFLLVMNKLRGEDMMDVINDLSDYAVMGGYGFYALTSATADEIERWVDHTSASYPFFRLDDITLKTIVRSNPGMLLVKDGIITAKWSRNDLPREISFDTPLESQPWAVQTPSMVHHRRLRALVLMFFPYFFIAVLDALVRRKRR